MTVPPGMPEPRERGEGRLELPPSQPGSAQHGPDDDRQDGATGSGESYHDSQAGGEAEDATPNLHEPEGDSLSGSAYPGAGNGAAQRSGRAFEDASRAAAAYELSLRAAQNQAPSQASQAPGQASQAGQAGQGGYAGRPGQAHDAVKIGLWGSPSSGKTTYLAALRHAAADPNTGCGTWGIFPLNQQSRTVMVDFTHALNQGQFPDFTAPGTKTELKWLFVGDITKSRFARRQHRPWRRGRLESRFELDLIDVSGEAFGYNPDVSDGSREVADVALKHLYEARGLIYLFDPIRERDNRDALNYVNRTIAELKERFAQNGYRHTHLPHHVSVCITKFDHPDVFQEARRHGFVEYGPDGMPRVPDRHAEAFFDLLCTGKFWGEKYEQSDRSARFVRNELRNAFDPANIEYFVTSSIGFWKPPGWVDVGSDFDPEDFANYRKAGNDQPSIRGAISPINVLEPLIRLQQRVSGWT